MTIYVSKDEVLRSREYLHALAKRIFEMRMSRLAFMGWLSTVIAGCREEIRLGDGTILRLHPDIVEEVYGQDLACSWNTAVKVFASRMPLRRSKRSMLPRLRLIDAAFKSIEWPIIVGG